MDRSLGECGVKAHCPGLGDAARLLAGRGDETHYARLLESFPPAVLAHLEFGVGSGRDVGRAVAS